MFTKEDTKVIKGVAIIYMLIHHLFPFTDRIVDGNYYISIFSVGEHTIEYWLGCIGNMCVGFFMFLSAYGSSITYLKLVDKNQWNKKCYLKLKNFFIIFWQVFLIFVPIGFIIGYYERFSISEFFLNFFCIGSSYNLEWWFATPFIVLTICFPIIYHMLKSENVYLCLLEICGIASLIRYVLPEIMGLDIFSDFTTHSFFWNIIQLTLNQLPMFSMGVLVARFDLLNRVLKIMEEKLTEGISLCISVAFVSITSIMYITDGGIYATYAYIYILFLIVGWIYIIRKVKNVYRILYRIGEVSTYMWLIHSFFCYYFFQKITYYPKISIIVLLWLTVLTFVTAQVVKYFWIVVKKVFMKDIFVKKAFE